MGSVNLFNTGTTAALSLSGNDLSINFGANGITSLLTETGVSGTGKPTTNFGDGWYALGIDPTGNPSAGQTMWLTFFRLFGSATGDETVTGPYTTAGTDAAVVYAAIGETGTLLNADVDGSGAVNSKDLSYTVAAKGDAVGATAPSTLPAIPVVCRRAGRSWSSGGRTAGAGHADHAATRFKPWCPRPSTRGKQRASMPPTCASSRACRSLSAIWARAFSAWKPAA